MLDLRALIDELVASEAANKKQLNDDHELALILADEDGGTATQKAVHKEMKKRAAAATKALQNAAKAASKLATKSRKTPSTRKGQGAINKGVGATSLVAYERQRAETFADKDKVCSMIVYYQTPLTSSLTSRSPTSVASLRRSTPSKVCSKLGSSER